MSQGLTETRTEIIVKTHLQVADRSVMSPTVGTEMSRQVGTTNNRAVADLSDQEAGLAGREVHIERNQVAEADHAGTIALMNTGRLLILDTDLTITRHETVDMVILIGERPQTQRRIDSSLARMITMMNTKTKVG